MPQQNKNVLDVGNCGFDHANLRAFLARHFDVELTQAHSVDDAKRLLNEKAFDLVLVNRKFDCDGGDGIELIREIKSDPNLATTPVLLLSNYPKYQELAIAAGAEPGFGKAELDSEASINAVKSALG